MHYKKFDSRFVLSIQKGEEIIECLKKFCGETGIKAGSIQGIGATDDVTIGYFNLVEKKFHPKTFSDKNYEITSLIGNISTFKNEPVIHIHINIADNNYQIFGGHLNKATISAACEIFIDPIEDEISRSPDTETGLNLINLA